MQPPDHLERKWPRTAVTVYGDDYETADGTCIRDYRPSCDRAVLVIAVRASSVLTTGA